MSILHIRIPCHIMSVTRKTIRFVREHSHELIDLINDVCSVAQAMLNHGTHLVVADVYKTGTGKMFWTIAIDGDESKGVITKDGIMSSAEIRKHTRVWSYVMENLAGDDFWNDHYYSDPLSYDSHEIDVAIELIEMWAED